jgi:hypothetical protein
LEDVASGLGANSGGKGICEIMRHATPPQNWQFVAWKLRTHPGVLRKSAQFFWKAGNAN